MVYGIFFETNLDSSSPLFTRAGVSRSLSSTTDVPRWGPPENTHQERSVGSPLERSATKYGPIFKPPPSNSRAQEREPAIAAPAATIVILVGVIVFLSHHPSKSNRSRLCELPACSCLFLPFKRK